MFVVTGRIGGKFSHVEIAKPDGARCRHTRGDCRGDIRTIVAQYFAAAGGDASLAIEHIFVRQRHAVKRPQLAAALEHTVSCARGPQCVCFLDGDETIYRRLHRLGPCKTGTRDLQRRNTLAADRLRYLAQAHIQKIGTHPRTCRDNRISVTANPLG